MKIDPTSQGVTDAIRREVRHSALRARNGLRYLAGINPPPVGKSPRDLIWSRDKATLWRYQFGEPRYAPPVVLFLGLVSRSYVLDMSPDNSFVGTLGRAGFDVYLLDWGVPDEADAGNTFETYVDFYLPRALAAAAAESGTEQVTLLPYCMGSIFALLYAAAGQSPSIRAMPMLAPPLDFSGMGVLVTPLRDGTIEPDEMIDNRGLLPGETVRGFFSVRRPTADVVQYVNLWEKLASEKAVHGHAAMAQWVRDQIPVPGATFRQMVELFIRGNAFMSGRVRLGNRFVSLRDITMPILSITAEHDDVVPNPCTLPLPDLVSSAVDRLHIQSGHVSLVMGRHAQTTTLPGIVDWLSAHSDKLDG
jgi:polyhydroxyalkanoate synthase